MKNNMMYFKLSISDLVLLIVLSHVILYTFKKTTYFKNIKDTMMI
jgi:hypothetical protein